MCRQRFAGIAPNAGGGFASERREGQCIWWGQPKHPKNLVQTDVDVELITALGGDHNALALSTASRQRNVTDSGF